MPITHNILDTYLKKKHLYKKKYIVTKFLKHDLLKFELYEDLLHAIMKFSSYKIVVLHLCWLTGPRVDIIELPVGGAPTLTVCT